MQPSFHTLSLLGSTGSIGTNTLDVVRSHPGRFCVAALACGNNIALLKEQILEFRPRLVSVGKPDAIPLLKEALGENAPEIVWGTEGAIAVATHPEAEIVVSAMVGAAGLLPTLRAIESKKTIALANKETMVIAGELMNQAAYKAQVRIFPVDSEHSAIFQSLVGHNRSDVRRLILTASGGPFRTTSKEDLEHVSLAQALNHPNWKMGAKITIDSATLMNKGLEVIEARWLFDIPAHQIEVVVHPQSVIHSMVEYHDGSLIAQLGIPDMRIPIAYALSYPERLQNSLPPLKLADIQNLTFFEPDLERFPCLRLAKFALKQGGDAPCVLNAANEVIVEAFLKERIQFREISGLIEKILREQDFTPSPSLEHLLKVDQLTRQKAHALIEQKETFHAISRTSSHR